jgi:hypothetical protein
LWIAISVINDSEAATVYVRDLDVLGQRSYEGQPLMYDEPDERLEPRQRLVRHLQIDEQDIEEYGREGFVVRARLSSVRRSGVLAKVQTDGPGRVRMRLLSSRRKLFGSVTKTVTSATTVQIRVTLNAAGRRSLRQVRRSTVTLKCAFTNTQGTTSTTSRKIVLRR